MPRQSRLSRGLEEGVLDKEVIGDSHPGGLFLPFMEPAGSFLAALKKLGVEVIEVPEQAKHDGRFPTVESPNPENAEALKMAMEQAEATGAQVVLATDPDADRMGAAVRNAAGELVLLTGNVTGTPLAEYRIATLKESE